MEIITDPTPYPKTHAISGFIYARNFPDVLGIVTANVAYALPVFTNCNHRARGEGFYLSAIIVDNEEVLTQLRDMMRECYVDGKEEF